MYIFANDANDPDDVKRKRELSALLQQRATSDYNPNATILDALASALNGFGAYRKGKEADTIEGAGRASGNELVKRLLGGNETAPQSVPSAGQASGGSSSARDAIASIESGGRYDAIGPVTKKGDRAYGKYQVMGANISSWSRAALGKEVSAQEFLANPEIQDKVFDHRFGGYIKSHGPKDAASMWFTGRPLAQGANARDQLGTSGQQYADKFMAKFDGASQVQPAGGQEQPQQAPQQASLQQLQSAIMSPQFKWVDPQMQQMIIGQYEFALKNSQPMGEADKLDLETKRLDLEQKRNPQMTPYQQEQIKIDREKMANNQVGQREYGLQPIITQEPPGPNGEPGRYHLFQASKDGGEPKEIKLPYGWTPQQQYLDTGTGFQAAPRVGAGTTSQVIPKNVAGEAADAARGKQQGEAQARLPVASISAQQTISKIDELLSNPGLGNVSGRESYYPAPIAGIADWMSGTPDGQTTVDLRSRVSQLMGGAFLEARDELKGAGQVTDFEGNKAADAYARMQDAQTDGAFKTALKDFRDAVIVGYQKLEAKANVPVTKASDGSILTGPAGTFELSDEELLKKYGVQ